VELPKKKQGDSALETAAPMKTDANATAPATGGTSASGTSASGHVALGRSCTIHDVQALRAHILEQTAHPGPYVIDGSGVQQVDTAGVQLVVAFALDCLERGVHYTWTGRSPALEEAVRVLGVAALLESPGFA
jgi:anti-anti-sigma regulatory factor